LIFSLCLVLSGCNNTSSTQEQAAQKTSTTSTAIESLPSIPLEEMKNLYEKCNHVDYLFYESNFSMSMDNQGSIKQTLTHVSESVPVLDKPCKGIGRIFYEVDGETVMEAEIYFSNECQHFVFMRNNKRLYANNITPDGVAHFKNIFKQASQMSK